MLLASMSILPNIPVYCPLKLGASELVGRPSLMLPPCIVEEGKLEYRFYSPLKKYNNNRDKGFEFNYCFSPLKQDLVRFNNRHKQQQKLQDEDEDDVVRFDNSGGKKELDLILDQPTDWVGSSHGWLILFNGNNRNMYMLNPVSGRSIQLPPFREPFLDEKEKPANPLKVMLSTFLFLKKEKRPYPLKVILSHSPDNENCRALAIHGCYNRAAFCSPTRCERWSPLGGGRSQPQPRHSYIDFVYCASRKAFVSVKKSGGVEEVLEFWDPSSRMEVPVKTLTPPPFFLSSLGCFGSPTPGLKWWTYLVSEEESGQLYMVRRYQINDSRVDYDVYAIHNHNGREVVEQRDSLDGLVMFVGMNHSFAARASRFPEYKPNCIYFTGIWFNQENQFADIYDYDNKAYSKMFDFSPDQKYWPFHSPLPWFTLTQTSIVSNLKLDLLL